MKKILSIFGSFTLAITTTSTLVSCTPTEPENTNTDKDDDKVKKLTISDIIKQPALGEITKPVYSSSLSWLSTIGGALAEVAEKIDENKIHSNFIIDILPAYSALLSANLRADEKDLKGYGDNIILSGQYDLDLTTDNIATLYDKTQSSEEELIRGAGKDAHQRVQRKLNTSEFQFVSSSVKLTFTFVD